MSTDPRAQALIAPPRPTRVTAAETPKGAIASPLIVTAIIVTALYLARDILIPIAIAVLLSFVIAPLVNLIRRLKLGRLFSVLVSVLIAAGIIGALSTVIGVQVADLAKDVPRYQHTIERKIEGLRHGPLGTGMDYLTNINRAIHDAGNDADKQKKADTSQTKPDPAPAPVIVEMKDRPPSPFELANTVLSPVLGPLATAGIVLVVLLFILMQREDLRDRLIRLAGSSDLHRTTVAMDDAARRLSRYFIGQLALNSGFGIVIGLGLWAIGVPNPVLWGIFSALMRFVPYIGAFLSAVFPVAVAAAVDPGWGMAIATLALFGVIEPIVGQIIEPLVYGHSTGLSPFAVLVSALFWIWLWGPVGLILSTPLTVCLVVLGRHVDSLEFLDVLFSDRPALTPIENFYQRMLADDPEEAQEHADLILRQCSLSAYYDEVVLKGLELASRDATRGVLTLEQKSDIRTSITALIDDLESRRDERPARPKTARRLFAGKAVAAESAFDPSPAVDDPPEHGELPEAWRQEGAVLCVAGRGFLDEPAAAILAQLLRKLGLGTRLAEFSELARAKIDNFDAGPVQMVVVISLAIGGEPGHVRRLVGRLRSKLPGKRIAVGLWQIDEDSLGQAGRREIDADEHVSSLRDAVEAVLSSAGTKAGAAAAEAEKAAAIPPRQAMPTPA
ncbi:AI-2E family transporter [Methylobacterium brachythecii]|uniref:Putative PurR-regulated permease PerM n=1 Tax=Methylobacterium brachythecii TaxID=1176177 RepID=A0A7W6F4U8_9HYPH|nr:AI-2E family transporter [Methylobacterium brachythecii]MBB3900544.1 putative PurR-regulated permease PerM [Methylobacterium brachythecii]